jgi:hypothetical protein
MEFRSSLFWTTAPQHCAIDARRFEIITLPRNVVYQLLRDTTPDRRGTDISSASLARPANSMNPGIVHRAVVGACVLYRLSSLISLHYHQQEQLVIFRLCRCVSFMSCPSASPPYTLKPRSHNEFLSRVQRNNLLLSASF